VIYQIQFNTSKELLEAMTFLCKTKGFCFTQGRARSDFGGMYNFADWLYITVGHDEECKMVMNTAGYKDAFNSGRDSEVVSWPKFKEEILPTY
jgi:hypothetical protein